MCCCRVAWELLGLSPSQQLISSLAKGGCDGVGECGVCVCVGGGGCNQAKNERKSARKRERKKERRGERVGEKVSERETESERDCWSKRERESGREISTADFIFMTDKPQ